MNKKPIFKTTAEEQIFQKKLGIATAPTSFYRLP